ncbi:MAG: hypothetical protein AB8E82_21085 [Aureispira sp.]
MKLLCFIFLFLGFAMQSQAQTIDEIPVDKIDVEYAKIVAVRTNSAGRYTIFISIGQEEYMRDRKGTPVKDAAGDDIEINTPVKALNLMDELGFELVKAYVQDAENWEHFILRRKKG